jgi:hypothetical protein
MSVAPGKSTNAAFAQCSLSDAAFGLAGCLLWAVVTVVRLGAEPSVISLLAASFACASVCGVPLVIVLRSMRASRSTLASFAMAASSSLLPVAVFAALVKQRTHHRALGGVTVAAGATFIVLFAYLVVRRVRAMRPSPGARALRAALVTLCALSVLWALSTMLAGGSQGASRDAAVDGAVGLSILGLSASARGPAPSPPASRAVTAAGGLVVLAGLALLRKSPSLLANLCEHAPVTLGLARVFGCP